MSLLEEKVQLFRGMWEGLSPAGEEVSRPPESFFRSACSQELPRGASIMKDALQEGKRSRRRGCCAQSGSLVSEQKRSFGPFTVNFDDFLFFLFVPLDNSGANRTSVREHSG